jgi:aryl-alcohol dehydrogenase-like predicted oxidoreductase
MEQRAVGATGLSVSRLGLGTMTWGRDTDEHEARDQLIAFVDAGGTLVDTAAGYGDGAAEELLGRLVRDAVSRDEVVIATKAGISRRSGRRETYASRGRLLTELDASLARLGVDHVDLWQVHTWVDGVPVEETLTALDLAVTSGRASYVGISNYTGWQPPGSAPSPAARAWPPPRWSTPSSTAGSSWTSSPRPPPSDSGSCPGHRSAAGC